MKHGWVGRQKVLTYRAQSPVGMQAHEAHWKGFTWNGGNVITSYKGPWGEIQVWAASEAEGRRVIGHACKIADIPLQGPKAGEWSVATISPGRLGRPGVYQTATINGVAVVTSRIGASGSPELARQEEPIT